MATILQAEQGSEEWLQARVGLATASRFADIISKTRSGYSASRKNYMAELVVEILTGNNTEMFTSSAMQWGTDTEPVARLQYLLMTGNEVEETSLWLHDTLPVGASPDGLVNDKGTIEIKCPNTATHIETLQSKKVPPQYYAQIQGQLWMTDRDWCDFVSFDPRLPENAQIIVIHVPRDQKFIEEMEAEIRKFCKEVNDQVNFIRSYK